MPVTDVNSYLQFLLLYKMVLHGGSDVIFHSLVIKKVANINKNSTGCPEKNEPQYLLNISGYKHARKLGHNSLERWDP